MKKRFSLLLALTMILSAFTGLSVDAAYRYSDTIGVVEGVEVFQEGGTTYWMANFYDGEAKGYLTHDSYQETTAYLVQASNNADTTNYQLHPEWSGVDAKVGSTYKFTIMVKPLKGTLDWLIRYGDDLLEKYTPTYYDPETNEVVTENFEKKWYRAEVEFEMTEKGKSTWYGLGIISSTTYIMDDIKCYEKVDGSYNVVPECGLVIDDRFETNKNENYTENIPEEEEPEYRYSDTIEVVNGVEVFQEENMTYWMAHYHDGNAKGYLTHDAYQGTTAMLIKADGKSDTTNHQLHPEWSGVDAKVGSTYKFTFMVKPLDGALDFSIRYGDDYTEYAPKYYDPETNAEVTENFAKKWYRAEVEFVMTEKGKSTWYGLGILSSVSFIMDDVKCYEKVGDSYEVVPECGLVIDDRFETHANNDYTEILPEEPEEVINRYSDTIAIVDGVEVFQEEGTTYWMSHYHDGEAKGYLTHDAYQGTTAYLVQASNNADTTNHQLHPEWSGVDAKVGATYKFTIMVKPLKGTLDWLIRYGDDLDVKYKPTYIDPDTNEAVTENFEKKWYRAEVEFEMTEKGKSTWYGLGIISSTSYIMDDIKCYEKVDGSYNVVPECGLVIDDRFETHAKEYTEITYVVSNLNKGDKVVAGDNTVTVDIKNLSEEDFTAELILALYNKDTNTFINAGGSENVSIGIGEKETLNAKINVPSLDGGNYEIKVFVWDALTGARPLMNSVVIAE